MRRAPLLSLAAAVALAAPALVLVAAARNRGGAVEAEVVLTDQELRLATYGEAHRWAALRLDWNRDQQWTRNEPGWFGRAKLAELGFDTRLPAEDSRASGFYARQPAREVFLALEYDGPAAAQADVPTGSDGSRPSRLHPVDAATSAQALRARHPDRHRVLVVRAVVSAECFGSWDLVTRKHGRPFLRGRIRRLLVEAIQLPREKRALLDAIASGTSSANAPRYRVVLRTGRRLEPWVAEVLPPP